MVVLADVDERAVENKTKRLKTKKRTHQCAPSANPLIATAANTPPGVGDAHTTAIPTATSAGTGTLLGESDVLCAAAVQVQRTRVRAYLLM